ncbi:hypothetical protein SDC9_199320 [bioreactor metagenome]|uniref:Arc-like DNA binding domain-containing protein n=1 Tax=bioreactor metagenome TaxID=1076179 RepID=A0A645IK57_9ZZZZ
MYMPSDKKRINLTVPDEVYAKLRTYKGKNGITNDASACLQLIVQQLQAQENNELIFKAIRALSEDDLKKISQEGIAYTKELAEKLSK